MFLSKTENILRTILTHGHLHHPVGDTSCLSPSKLSGSTPYFISSLFKPFIEAVSLLLVIVTKALQPFLTWRRKCLLATTYFFLSILPSLCANSRQDAADISPLRVYPSSLFPFHSVLQDTKTKSTIAVWVDSKPQLYKQDCHVLYLPLVAKLINFTQVNFIPKNQVMLELRIQPTSVRVPKPSQSGGISLFKQILAIILINSCNFLLFSGGRRRQQI